MQSVRLLVVLIIVDEMLVPCCFCMKEFPTWTSVVTSHIASHVKIKSIRCVECCLSFASKDALMIHLHSCHSVLPKGICIDVSIENHERRYLQCNGDVLPGTEALLASKDLLTEKPQYSSGKSQDVGTVNQKELCADMTAYKPGVTGTDRRTESSISNTVCDTDVEPSSSISVSLEGSASTPTSHTASNVKGSANISVTKKCRRKLYKPSHVVVHDTGSSEIICANDYNWVEIVAATQPMIEHCPHCTFTCNTELQLKVLFLV